jgi:hypothetical protein
MKVAKIVIPGAARNLLLNQSNSRFIGRNLRRA